MPGWPDQRAYRQPAQKTCLATVCELARTQALTLRGIVQLAEAIHGHPIRYRSTDRGIKPQEEWIQPPRSHRG